MKKWSILLLSGLCCFHAAAMPVFQPAVKEYKSSEGRFQIQRLPVYHEKQRQCQIAAMEIPNAGKVNEGIHQISNRGIYIATAESPAGKTLVKEFSLNVPQKKQGYTIAVQDGRIAIVGFDPQGALYGAITLRQMLEDGKIQNSVVRDWPDILYRGSMSFGRGLAKWANEEGNNAKAAFFAGIDEMLHHKLNIMGDYFGIEMNSPVDTLKNVAELNRYAVERGIYPNLYPSTAVWVRCNHPKTVNPKNWKCIVHQYGWDDLYYCWSDDKLTAAAAERYAQWMKKIGAEKSICVIHPVDGGAIPDPEEWSKRCQECRARWKDDERWKASINQFDIWNRVLRKHFPDAIIGSCVYPYTIGVLAKPMKERDAAFRQNVVEYWHKLSRGLMNKDFFFSSWITSPALFKPYRELIGKRRLHFSDTYSITAGIFATYHRYSGSIYEENSENIFCTQATDAYGQWESLCLVSEHTWNRHAPGSEIFNGDTYYDAMKDHIGPVEVMQNTLPRICHTFWGKDLAPYMVKIMSSGITPGYISKPAHTVRYWNDNRKDSLHDPNIKKKVEIEGKLQPIIDGPELMKKQMEAAQFVCDQLDQAKKHIAGLDRYKRKYFMYFAKRAPYWLAAARAQYNIRCGNLLVNSGKNAEAVTMFDAAKKQMEADFDVADRNMKELNHEIDTEWRFEWNLDRKTMRKMIDNASDSAKVVLQPRRLGRYIRIGITNGESAKGTKEFLDDFLNVKTTVIDNITLAELDRFDCVFVTMNSYDKNDFFRNIASYVEKGGGGVYLEGPLCGHKRFDGKNPFPQIVKNAPQHVENFNRDLLRMDGTPVKSMYVDYFELVPGNAGETILKSKTGKPVAVRGKAGLGKVVFCSTFNLEGLNNSYAVGKTKLFGINAEIVKSAVEYFTNLKLKENQK